MQTIIPDITSIAQYLEIFKNDPERLRPKACLGCGRKGVHRHQTFWRKPNRFNDPKEPPNSIPIEVFYCPGCKISMSVLPECICPRRWHTWSTQQRVLLGLLAKESLRSIKKQTKVSRSTIRRWAKRFNEQLLKHVDTICTYFPTIIRHSSLSSFWSACLEITTLAKTMYCCHAAGIIVP